MKNQPFQTLSPLPRAPTLFMPSFQSPVPISGRPCAPELVAVLQGADAVFVDGPRLLAHPRQAVVLLLVGTQHRRLQEGHSLVEEGSVAGHGDVVVDDERQEVQVVGDAGADAAAGRRVPPVLYVAFLELPARPTAGSGPASLPGHCRPGP